MDPRAACTVERDRYRWLLDAIEDSAVCALDAEGRVVSCSRGGARLTGWDPDEILGQSLACFHPADEAEAACELLARAAATGRAEDEGWRVRKDGSRFRARSVITPLRDDGGALQGFAVVLSPAARTRAPELVASGDRQNRTPMLSDLSACLRDLTEHQRAEAALRESEQRFRQLADAMPQIVWSARADGRLDYHNRRWYEFTGFPVDESDDPGWVAILHPDDVERCMAAWYGAVRSGEPYQIEFRFRDHDAGRYRWFLGRALPVRDESGRIVRWFGTCTDIDAQKRGQEERDRLLGELRRALSVREKFLAIASHELKTPLTTLLLQVQAMLREARRAEDRLPPENVIQRACRLHTHVERLATLVNQLLDVSQIAAGQLSVHYENLDLAELAGEVVARFDDAASKARCPMQLEASDEASGRWDRLKLDQVLSHLLSNAIKYGAGKPIEVRVESDEERVHLTVRDHGIGIPREDQERIFERFERVVSERHYSGFGLGLWVSREMVLALGGTIRVASEPGRGSCFSVELPRLPKATLAIAAGAPATDRTSPASCADPRA